MSYRNCRDFTRSGMEAHVEYLLKQERKQLCAESVTISLWRKLGLETETKLGPMLSEEEFFALLESIPDMPNSMLISLATKLNDDEDDYFIIRGEEESW